MNHLSIAGKPVSALALFLLLSACGPFSIDPLGGLGSRQGTTTSIGGSLPWWRDLGGRAGKPVDTPPWIEAGPTLRELADELRTLGPDVIALRDAVTWRRDGAVLHDDVELLLDELGRRDLVDVLAPTTYTIVVACGADMAELTVDTLRDAGYAAVGESRDGLLLGRDAVASEGR